MEEELQSLFSASPKYLSVASINYDYIPTVLEGPKVLWVGLKWAAPKDLKIGSHVRVHLRPGIGINTDPGNPELNSVFEVQDIIGTSVVLGSVSKKWHPNLGNKNISGWGHDLRRTDVRPLRQDWNFGYGTQQSFVQYYPNEY